MDKGPGPHLQKTGPQNKEKTGQTLIIKACKGEGKGTKSPFSTGVWKVGFFFLIYEFFFLIGSIDLPPPKGRENTNTSVDGLNCCVAN